MDIITPDETARAQIAKAYQEYARALARHDAAALAALYDADAVILAPGAQPVSGTEAIRAYCEGICALPYDFDMSGFTIEHVLAVGDCFIETSRFTTANAPLDDGDARAVKQSKNLVVWRNRGGRWLIAREMYSDIRT
jgi:uncharacterized protein (TIGR02246 family)